MCFGKRTGNAYSDVFGDKNDFKDSLNDQIDGFSSAAVNGVQNKKKGATQIYYRTNCLGR